MRMIARPLRGGEPFFKEFSMVRSWLRASFCVLAALVFGCEKDNRESVISNSNNLVSEVATSAGNIKNRVEEFMRKKESGKDDEGAKKEIDEAVAEAKKLEETALKLQNLSSRANSLTPPTAEEKKAYLAKFQPRIITTQEELKNAHRDMKKVLTEANDKYSEAMKPLMQELSKAESAFAAIVRRK